jgi:hypothetical protein
MVTVAGVAAWDAAPTAGSESGARATVVARLARTSERGRIERMFTVIPPNG